MRRIAIVPIFLSLSTGSSAMPPPKDFCTSVEALIALARDGFELIDEGPDRPGAMSDHTSWILPGADSCNIVQEYDGPTYWCTWLSTRQAVLVHAQALTYRIGACLGTDPDWIRDDDSVSAFIEQQGVEFYVSGSQIGEPASIDLAVEFIGDDVDPFRIADQASWVRAHSRDGAQLNWR